MKIHATSFHRFPWRTKLRDEDRSNAPDAHRKLMMEYFWLQQKRRDIARRKAMQEAGRVPAYCRDLSVPCLDKLTCPKETSCDLND